MIAGPKPGTHKSMPDAIAPSDTAARLAGVSSDIARACRDANRDISEVTLVAVSKTFPADAIEPVIEVGHRVFGENRVQEAKTKWPPLQEKYAARHEKIELHLIGPLQSNKAKEAVALFDAIHSVDRDSLCDALAKEIAKQGRSPLLFAQINTGSEAQKAGVLPQDADAFLKRCVDQYGLKISGLMCIPPIDEAPGPHFALTHKIAKRNGLKLLSMGMIPADAIEPVIEVGHRVFGENRVQEAKTKWPPLQEKYAARHEKIELHLIGPLQSNKAKEAVALFDAIHSVDRDSLCDALAKEIAKQGRSPLLFASAQRRSAHRSGTHRLHPLNIICARRGGRPRQPQHGPVSVHAAASRRHARHVAGAYQQDIEAALRRQCSALEGPHVRVTRPRQAGGACRRRHYCQPHAALYLVHNRHPEVRAAHSASKTRVNALMAASLEG